MRDDRHHHRGNRIRRDRRPLGQLRPPRSRPLAAEPDQAGTENLPAPPFPGVSAEAATIREMFDGLADAENTEAEKVEKVSAELEQYRREGRRREVAKSFDAGTKTPPDRTAAMEGQLAESKRLIEVYRRMQVERLGEIEDYLRAIPEAALARDAEIAKRIEKEVASPLRRALAAAMEMTARSRPTRLGQDRGTGTRRASPYRDGRELGHRPRRGGELARHRVGAGVLRFRVPVSHVVRGGPAAPA